MTETRFVQILWIYVGLVLASIAAYFFSGFSAELAVAYENEPEPWLMRNVWIGAAVLLPMLFAWIVGLVGLFFFKSWARALSLAITLLGLVLTVGLGPSLSSGLEASLLEASSILWGAILALAYFSPVSARFER